MMICVPKLWWHIKTWGYPQDGMEYAITDRLWLDSRGNYIDNPPKEDELMIDLILKRCKAIKNMIKTIYTGDIIPNNTGFYKSGKNGNKRWMFCWGGQRII